MKRKQTKGERGGGKGEGGVICHARITSGIFFFFFTLSRDDISYTMKTLLAEAFARIASNELISDKYLNI